MGEHRSTLAKRNIKEFLNKTDLPYHSPHKFRHGHLHYALERSKTFTDYKAASQNVMHAKMEITDEIYSNLNDREVENRIGTLGKDNQYDKDNLDIANLIKEILIWKQRYKSS